MIRVLKWATPLEALEQYRTGDEPILRGFHLLVGPIFKPAAISYSGETDRFGDRVFLEDALVLLRLSRQVSDLDWTEPRRTGLL